jgi:two-component system response regulator
MSGPELARDERRILLVEDNDGDAELLVRALSAAGATNPVDRVCDGVEALDYLWARGAFAHRSADELPVLVLLDLALPRMTGLEVLAEVTARDLSLYWLLLNPPGGSRT